MYFFYGQYTRTVLSGVLTVGGYGPGTLKPDPDPQHWIVIIYILSISSNISVSGTRTYLLKIYEIHGYKKKGGTTNFFPLLFFVVVGPWIRNGKNPDPGSRIRDNHPGSITLIHVFFYLI
jgi:hypothetical protein